MLIGIKRNKKNKNRFKLFGDYFYNKLIVKENKTNKYIDKKNIVVTKTLDFDIFIEKINEEITDIEDIKNEMYIFYYYLEENYIHFWNDKIMKITNNLNKFFSNNEIFDEEFVYLKLKILIYLQEEISLNQFMDFENIINNFLSMKDIGVELYNKYIIFNINYNQNLVLNEDVKSLDLNNFKFIFYWGYNNYNLIKKNNTLNSYLVYIYSILKIYTNINQDYIDTILIMYNIGDNNIINNELYINILIILELNGYKIMNNQFLNNILSLTKKINSINLLIKYLKVYLKLISDNPNANYLYYTHFIDFIKDLIFQVSDSLNLILILQILYIFIQRNIISLDEKELNILINNYLLAENKKHKIKLLILKIFNYIPDYIYQIQYNSEFKNLLISDCEIKFRPKLIREILLVLDSWLNIEYNNNIKLLNYNSLKLLKYEVDIKITEEFKNYLIYSYIVF